MLLTILACLAAASTPLAAQVTSATDSPGEPREPVGPPRVDRPLDSSAAERPSALRDELADARRLTARLVAQGRLGEIDAIGPALQARHPASRFVLFSDPERVALAFLARRWEALDEPSLHRGKREKDRSWIGLILPREDGLSAELGTRLRASAAEIRIALTTDIAPGPLRARASLLLEAMTGDSSRLASLRPRMDSICAAGLPVPTFLRERLPPSPPPVPGGGIVFMAGLSAFDQSGGFADRFASFSGFYIQWGWMHPPWSIEGSLGPEFGSLRRDFTARGRTWRRGDDIALTRGELSARWDFAVRPHWSVAPVMHWGASEATNKTISKHIGEEDHSDRVFSYYLGTGLSLQWASLPRNRSNLLGRVQIGKRWCLEDSSPGMDGDRWYAEMLFGLVGKPARRGGR